MLSDLSALRIWVSKMDAVLLISALMRTLVRNVQYGFFKGFCVSANSLDFYDFSCGRSYRFFWGVDGS